MKNHSVLKTIPTDSDSAAKPFQETTSEMTKTPYSLLQLIPIRLCSICFSGILAALVSLVVGAAEPVDSHPELTRLSPKQAVWVDAQSRQLIVGGVVALADGPIEFFACPRKTKEHESVVAVNATAQLVHTGLLAIGLRAGNPASFYPKFKPATGDSVAITVRWHDDTGDHETPAQRWVKNSETGEELDYNWIFAGSSFWKNPKTNIEYYQADGGDLVCVSNFPAATLDLPITSSQANNSLLFEVFTGRVPKRGTSVELVFSHAEQEETDEIN